MRAGFRDEETITLLEILLEHEVSIPRRLWRRILWLWEDGKTRWGSRGTKQFRGLGISRRRRFFWQQEEIITEYPWDRFFKEFTLQLNERDIRRTINEFLLFSKGENVTAREVLECRNIEVRSTLLTRVGWERILKETGGTVVDSGDYGLLIRASLGDGLEPLLVVKVFDSTSGQPYILRVPPYIQSVDEAVAWTFNMPPELYKPLKET